MTKRDFVRSEDAPATIGYVKEVKMELIHRIDGMDFRLSSRMDGLEARMECLRSEVKAEIHNLKALIEEQNARNKFVMDGLENLYYRQERVETKLESIS